MDLSGAHDLGGGKDEGDAAWPHRFHEVLQEPLTVVLYKRLSKLLDEGYELMTENLEIIGLDVTWGTSPHIQGGYTGYMFVLTCRGAFNGPQFNISNHVAILDPMMSDLVAKNLLFDSCKALRVGRAQQAFPNGRPPQPGLPG